MAHRTNSDLNGHVKSSRKWQQNLWQQSEAIRKKLSLFLQFVQVNLFSFLKVMFTFV